MSAGTFSKEKFVSSLASKRIELCFDFDSKLNGKLHYLQEAPKEIIRSQKRLVSLRKEQPPTQIMMLQHFIRMKSFKEI
jgi:hypothetical protein